MVHFGCFMRFLHYLILPALLAGLFQRVYLIGSILSSFFLSDERAGDAPQSGAASEGHRKL